MITQIQKMRRQSGVTLVELLVVILIVAILAVGLLPTFKKLIVEAQYANEPQSVVGSLRTQISLYMYEHNKVPVGDIGNDGLVYVFKKDSSAGTYVAKTYTPGTSNVDCHDPNSSLDDITSGEEHWLGKLELNIDQLQGNRLTPDQVHFACTANGGSWCYAIGVFGTGDDGALPANTGYAVMEANFGSVKVEAGTSGTDADGNTISTADKYGYHVLATWKNYDGSGTLLNYSTPNPPQISFSTQAAESCCAILDATAVGDNVQDLDAAEQNLANLNLANSSGTVCGKWTYPRSR